MRKILTIHDLIHEKYPNYFGSNNFNHLKVKEKVIYNSDFFICVSETTKRDFLEYYKISEDKVKVVYHGSDHLDIIDGNNFLFDDNLLCDASILPPCIIEIIDFRNLAAFHNVIVS